MNNIVPFLFLTLILSITSCGKDDENSSNGLNLLVSFSILERNNVGLVEDLLIEINEDEIFEKVPYTVNIDSLICDFKILGEDVRVNGISQQSGVTPNSFREPVQYDVYASDGTINSYIISIQYFTGLPVMRIQTNSGGTIYRDNYLEGTIDVFGKDFSEDFISEMEIRGRGNSTWNHPKKPYQIRFEEKQSLLGMPEDKKWVLLANYSDKTMLRNEIALNLGRFSNLDWTPESQYVELILDNEYKGTYQVTQKVEETKNRVDIGNDGFLLEVDQLARLDDDDVYFETENYLFKIKEPNLEFNDEEFLYIKDFIEEFEETLFGNNFNDPVDGYQKYIDVESFVDWYIINELTRNVDAIFHTSVYMNLMPGKKLKMGPIWDFDIAMGNINYGGHENTDGFHIKRASWYEILFQDEYFVEILKNRFEYFSQNKDFFFDKITEEADKINDSQRENFKKWEILGVYVWPNFVYPETYEEEVEYLREWLSTRWIWMENEISSL